MKKRVCFYGISTEMGGAERCLFDLARGLRGSSNSEWDPWVLLPKSTGPLVEALKAENIPYSVVKLPTAVLQASRQDFWSVAFSLRAVPELPLYFWRVFRLVKNMKPVLVRTTGLKCHLLGLCFRFFLGVPLLWHIEDIVKPGFTRFTLRFFIRWFRIPVIANSHATARAISGNGGEVEVVYNGVDPVEFYPKPNPRFRDHFGVSGDTLLVGILGVFASWKGQNEFLLAAKKLFDEGANVRFILVGDAIYDTRGEVALGKKYRALTEELGIESVVYFAGFVKEPALAINGLDILVHASIEPEPFGRVIVEAMACKVSLVVSKWGAAPEFFGERVHGLIVNPREPGEISAAIKWYIHHPEERAVMREKGYDHYLENFTLSHFKSSMEGEFRKLLVRGLK